MTGRPGTNAPGWVSALRAELALCGLVVGLSAWGGDTPGPAAGDVAKIRLAFTADILGELNRNDALASILAWGRAVLSQRNVTGEVIPMVIDRPTDLFAAMQRGEVDAVTVCTDDFLVHAPTNMPDSVFFNRKNGKATEQYMLLVRAGGGIQDLAGLKGRTLEWHRGGRTSLVPAWLDSLLAAHQLGLPEHLFRSITNQYKPSRLIGRVFFRQADACVVTRDAFETSAEMNPQLRKELRVLATSPEVVPSIFFFRPDYTSSFRQDMEEAILIVHTTPAGKQAMTVFQCDYLEKHPLSCLDTARALMADQARARGTRPPKAGIATASSPSGQVASP